MTAEQIRLLVVEDVPQVASHIRALLAAQSQIKMLDVIDAGERASGAVDQLKPDIVIVDALLQGRIRGPAVAEAIRREHPGVGIVMLTVPQNPVTESPERGIDAVLKMPFSGFDLTTTIRRTHEERSAAASRSGSFTVSLFAAKGGVGRTTLAFNLAVTLAANHRVCLVDGSHQFGDLRGLLRVPASAPSMVNLPTDRITEADVSDVMWRDPSGIDILLAPPRIEMAEMITVRDIEKVLSMLRQLYGFTIIDTRAGLQDDVLVYLDASDLVLQVLTYDSMAIRNMAMATETFAAIGYPPEKLAMLMNRADSSGGFDRTDVEQALQRRIDFEVVSDGRLLMQANNEGVPFVVSSPEAAISHDVQRIAAALDARLAERSPLLARR